MFFALCILMIFSSTKAKKGLNIKRPSDKYWSSYENMVYIPTSKNAVSVLMKNTFWLYCISFIGTYGAKAH